MYLFIMKDNPNKARAWRANADVVLTETREMFAQTHSALRFISVSNEFHPSVDMIYLLTGQTLTTCDTEELGYLYEI